MHMDLETDATNRSIDASWILGAIVMLWLACAVGGLFVVWAYENGPGTPATAESEWPATYLARARHRSADARVARASAVHLHARDPRRAG